MRYTAFLKPTFCLPYAAILFLLLAFTGCSKLAGLSLQTDAKHTPFLLNPNVNMNAWDYMKYRSGADTSNPAWASDTVFKLMYQAVLYSGIDTNEYTKPGRTFIFLHNLAVQNISGTPPVVSNNCYWGYYLIDSVAATSWTSYSPAQVKSWLQYLIVEGEYSFDNLTPIGTTVNTLLPPGTDTLNPQSIMVLARNNDQNAQLTINNFIGSFSYTTVRTGGIIATNGPIQVVGGLVIYKKTQ
jgi:hypothetical protein